MEYDLIKLMEEIHMWYDGLACIKFSKTFF